MSADNCIAILHTKEQFILDNHGCWTNQFDNPVEVWRIAHVQGVDNFAYLKEHQPYMLGHYMLKEWGNSKVYYSKEEALKAARALEETIRFLEYGIVTIEATEFDLSSW